MKVCHMTSVHSSLDDRIFYKECVSLAAAGYDTYLVAPGRSFVEKSVKVVGVGFYKVNRIQRMFVLSRIVYKKALEIDADIYHFHDPELLPYGIKLKRKGKKVIFDSHEDVPSQILAKEWIPLSIRKSISFLFKQYQKKVSRKIDCIVTATPYIANIFKAYGANAVAVRNFPILEEIDVDNSDYLERENIICYAGGLTEQRGIRELIKLSSKMEMKLLLAGDIDDEYKKELIKTEKVDNVNFMGKLNRKEIKDLYKKSKIGMALLHPTPNHINALAIKLFEYMGAGLPIVCSDFPLWKEIVENTGCGICVNPKDDLKVKERVGFLLDNPEIAKSMGDKGKELVNSKFNWEIEKENLLETYLSVLKIEN